MMMMCHVTTYAASEGDEDVRLTAEIPGDADETIIWVEIADDDRIRGAVQLERDELLAWAKEVVRLLDGGTP